MINYVLFLGIILVCALFSNRLMKICKLPAVTGYLIIGLVIALACLGFDALGSTSKFEDALDELNGFVSSVALGFIALSIGGEFSLSKIKKYGSKIITITFLQAFAAVIFVDAVVIGVCLIFKVNLAVALCLGAIATATAPAATIMVINQYKAKGPLVDLLLPVVAFDDAIGLVVFSISVSIAKVLATGAALSVISLVVLPLINIVGSLLIGFILGKLMHLIMPLFKSRDNHLAIFIAITLVGVGLCKLFNTIYIGEESLDISNLLCCMMIGATYYNIVKEDEKETMERDFGLVSKWTPYLFMLFFTLSGCHLVISAKTIIESATGNFIAILVIYLCYMVFRSLGKYFGAYLGCQITGQPKTIRNHLGITLLPQAGVAIGMANTISNMSEFKVDNIGSIIVTVVLSATLVYELIGPVLTKMSLQQVGEIPDENGNYPYLQAEKKSAK